MKMLKLSSGIQPDSWFFLANRFPAVPVPVRAGRLLDRP
jgi:hypothetical protein